MRMTRAKGSGVGERSPQNVIAHTALVSKHNGQDVRKAAREWGVFLEDVEGMSEEVASALLFSRQWRIRCVSSRGFEQKEHRKLSSLSIGNAHAF